MAASRDAVPLTSIYENMLEFSKDRLEEAQVSLELTSPLPGLSLKCNRMQISQVLLNLLYNAIDAIRELPIKWIKVETTLSADWIEIKVTDSGPGIPPEIRHHLMKPFFTTKPEGNGTGLGLAISEKILKAHGGSLNYNPTSEHTRFIARLPR
ncbi:MAG: GHKL domain-containing protein [Bdellovibrionales bacterium]|nr:GHKL domain-containing protein [Bdellovibrionales bacterium]